MATQSSLWNYHDYSQTASTTTHVQSVRPVPAPVAGLTLVDTAIDNTTFLVNTIIAKDQVQPSVAMDSTGNFAISWSSEGQSFSFFNGVYIRGFTADGKPVDLGYQVSQNDANTHENSAVALSDDGFVAVVWESYNPTLLWPDLFERDRRRALQMERHCRHDLPWLAGGDGRIRRWPSTGATTSSSPWTKKATRTLRRFQPALMRIRASTGSSTIPPAQ